YNAMQNEGNQVGQNTVQNSGIQNVGNQNELIGVLGIANHNRNGNVIAARVEGNGNGNNTNQIKCYNYRGMGHYARNYIVRPRRRDVAYLQTQLMIAQKEEARIQHQAEEFDLMVAVVDCEEIKKVNVNHILMANLQQALTSGTHAYKAPVYDSDGSAEDDSNVIPMHSSMDPSGGDLEQHPKVNTVNRETKEANVKLTAELARYRGREQSFEFNQAKFDELKNGYKKSVYQEQCLTKKINALHLSSSKMITTLNEHIGNLNNQLSKENSTILLSSRKREKLKSDSKTRKNELLDKLIELNKNIKELNNILVKMGQSIQMMHMLSSKPDLFYHIEYKMTLGYQDPFYLKQA
ncbi:hypothetical protein Tco_0549465, partial [Tanacetum coccineum]